MKLELKDYKHDYYCCDSCYTDNDSACVYETWGDFCEEWSDAENCWNYLFRWDIYNKKDDYGTTVYYMELFYMLQRKGKFVPILIRSITESDMNSISIFLKGKSEYIKNIWSPLIKLK